jgi:molybdate transport system ATP-binding protein
MAETGTNAAPFITLDRITVRVRDRWLLADTRWRIRKGENWVIWGPNGAGKSTLARVLTGQAAVVQGSVVYHDGGKETRPVTSLVSPEQFHWFYQREQLLRDMRHFAGSSQDPATAGALMELGAPARDGTNPSIQRMNRLFGGLNLEQLASRPWHALSSGELRKLLLVRALISDPQLLILDEPFNGLDAESRQQISRILEGWAAGGLQMVLITHRLSDIPDAFRHVLHLDRGRVVWQGDKPTFFSRMRDLSAPAEPPVAAPAAGCMTAPGGPPLIRMLNVSVQFGDRKVLDGIDWIVQPGEHWALLGPNGAGKSTLLELINGDQLQAYANEIDLFGRARGSGESVWEIKQQIGYVDDKTQARYQRRLTGFDAVCSGFFDSVGLYRHCTDEQRSAARQIVRQLDIAELAEIPMTHLSFGQQRLILIARAVVKSPRLLILDEPCNGLDKQHRRRLLDLLDRIARNGVTQLLYVSHRTDEIPACISHRLYLKDGKIIGPEAPLVQR